MMRTRGHICLVHPPTGPLRPEACRLYHASEWSNVEGILPSYRSTLRKRVDLVVFRRYPCPNWPPSSPRHHRCRLHAHSPLHRPQHPAPLLSSISRPLLARHRALRHVFLRRQVSARGRCGRRRSLQHEEVARHGWCEVGQGQLRGAWCCYIHISFNKNEPSRHLRNCSSKERWARGREDQTKTYSQTPRKTPSPARLHVPRPATH